MRQLALRTLVPAFVLALVVMVMLLMARSLAAAEAAETAREAVAAAAPASADLPFDPAMHAFFVDYLTRRWKLSVGDASSLAGWVLTYSARYETDPMVQLARVLKESGGRHYRPGASRSPAGVIRGSGREIGYSQIKPFWAGKRVEDITITRDMLYDPEGNIRAGIALYKRYENGAHNYLLALARYNRPGSRRPNGYAHAVDRLYRQIRQEHAMFAARQPGVYGSGPRTLLAEKLGEELLDNIYF